MENITNLTNKDYSSYVTQAQTSNLTNQIKKSTSSEATDEEMLAACKEFEAYLVEQVYKQVQSTIKSDSDEDDNPNAAYAYDLQAQQYAKLVNVIPRMRFGDPENDIAPVIAFLAGPDSCYYSGQSVIVDGANSIMP